MEDREGNHSESKTQVRSLVDTVTEIIEGIRGPSKVKKQGWVGPKLTRPDGPFEFDGGAITQSRGVFTLLSQLHTDLAMADSMPGRETHI